MPLQNSEQRDHGPGLYAVSTFPPSMGMVPGFPPNTLIPLTYKIPTRTNSTGTSEGHGQEVRQPQGAQRQVVRRFHFAFQLDVALIIKLAAVVFLFSQDGSRQRIILLMLFATFIYLYQTGALAPLIRWIRRVGAPPQPRAAVHPEQPPVGHDGNQLQPGNVQGENQDQPGLNEQLPAAVVNANPPEPERPNGNQLLEILKEIQMFLVGFIASLLPGFHNND
ncbi:hypothetical protein HPP92_004257 [Vanilla planifolia]|uniref:Uncharacterized protein n=1 Tax=Vanilla planifolia TaxID=51239 RepID=A0A835RWD4_VANPL|nr:hypothetical protein HPP92_004703 [Vanilla planifolia]KAG0493263.1 hypothetical protein HPP92_004257 [Vanilla planifolia]